MTQGLKEYVLRIPMRAEGDWNEGGGGGLTPLLWKPGFRLLELWLDALKIAQNKFRN